MDCDKIEKVGFQIRKVDNLIIRNMMCQTRLLGLDEVTVMNGWILAWLYENSSQDVFQKDIEAAFGVGRSTVTNIVKLMEKKQFIRRESVPEDARLKKLVITEKGIEANQKCRNMMDELELKLLESITPEEKEIFFRVLNKMKENLKRQEVKMKCSKH